MSLYCGIDLHSRNSYLAILNEERKLIKHGRLVNDLGVIVTALEPYREEIAGIAVESTFNWYWLVDGLMDHGYRLHLANPPGGPGGGRVGGGGSVLGGGRTTRMKRSSTRG